ncbi:MAG: hypothetical protein IJ833_10305 [Lachnospiraceae bacterium]|nr:hypothetical protein [Lachnospiraceae bacterium]
MAGLTLETGRTIYKYGQPMTALHLITSGKVKVSYPGGAFYLDKGGVIGICEICSEIHLLEYTVEETATIISYNIANLSVLDDLLEKHSDVSRLFLLSAFYQIGTMLEQCSVNALDCSTLHQNLTEDYIKYFKICDRYRVPPRVLEGLTEVEAYLGEDAPDFWLGGFYRGLAKLYSGDHFRSMIQDCALTSGFLRKCSLDIRRTYLGLEEQERYRDQIYQYYFHESGNDLFDLYTTLYYQIGTACEESDGLRHDIERMIQLYEKAFAAGVSTHDQRIQSFRSNLSLLRTSELADSTGEDTATLQELTGSLGKILDFAGPELENLPTLKQDVQSYKLLRDKGATDDDSIKLRVRLTKDFYQLYTILFKRTLETEDIPIQVWMYLYFGYLDEELAGLENATALFRLAKSMSHRSVSGVYTLYDWLMAIYRGEKMPSRDEFEQDFSAYVHKQKLNGEITDKQAKELEEDALAKVQYELHHMFPSVNKMTFGRITTFCPIFIADNMLKNPSDTYVTASAVGKALQQIKQIDYTAFYREVLDTSHMKTMGKETIHVEQLPDIILMPNAGIRGVMWQEIEGKHRNTPARMMLSIFHMEDLTTTMIRLTGEFRWEMCKRIQGGRWNDASERSLTSEYFDYIQFYRKNPDLTSEAKEKLHTALQRAKNSFKEMFVRDYITWIMFEGTGSPRMNKVSRRILFTYCPFAAPVLEAMEANPLYTELLSRYKLVTAQKLHRLNGLQKKISASGQAVPEALTAEIAYTMGTISTTATENVSVM